MWRSALESGNYEPLCSTSRESGGFSRQVEHMDVDTPFLARAGDRYARVRAQKDLSWKLMFPNVHVQATAQV